MKLGDITRESRETFKGDKTGIPIVGLEHLIPQELTFSAYDVDTDNTFTKMFHKGQILFGRRRAYLKKAAVAEFDGICSGDITVIEAIPGKVDKDLLPFIIQNDALFDYAVSRSAGGLSPRVKWEQLSDYEINLPPIEDQKVLADKLWAAYRLKEGYKKLLCATDEMVKSQFIEMFSKYPSETPWHKLLTIINGKVYPEEYNDIGTYPICGSAGVMYYGEKKLCDANTIILGRKGNINRPIYMESDYWIVDTAFCLDVNKSILHPKYFYYWCCQYDFTKLNKQGVLPSLTRKDLEKIEMSVPPMAEQKKFVSIAEQADKSKFGDFKSQFIEMFKNIPSVKIADCCITVSGGTPNTKKIEYYDGGDIPWLSSGEINQGYIFSTDKYITQLGLENSSAKWVPANSVVIAMYGATAGKVGFIKIPLTTNQAVCTLLPNDGFEPLYLYYATLSKTSWMISQCRGAAQPNISQSIIRSMEIPMATIDEQKRFCKLLTQADKSKSYVRIALKNLESILGYCIRQVA